MGVGKHRIRGAPLRAAGMRGELNDIPSPVPAFFLSLL